MYTYIPQNLFMFLSACSLPVAIGCALYPPKSQGGWKECLTIRFVALSNCSICLLLKQLHVTISWKNNKEIKLCNLPRTCLYLKNTSLMFYDLVVFFCDSLVSWYSLAFTFIDITSCSETSRRSSLLLWNPISVFLFSCKAVIVMECLSTFCCIFSRYM